MSVELQLDFCSEDKKLLVHQAFDEYAITNNCLHWDENVFVLIDSRVKDNPTWHSTNCMLEEHSYVAGPKKADKTNMIFY